MKSAAVVKTFTRKPRKAPPPAVVDFDTLRDTQNASQSSQDFTASQVTLDIRHPMADLSLSD